MTTSTRCCVEHCNNIAKYRGRCTACYNWWNRHGKVDRVLSPPEEITEDDDVVEIFPRWEALAAEHLRQYPGDDEIVESVGKQYRFTLDERVLRLQRWYVAQG